MRPFWKKSLIVMVICLFIFGFTVSSFAIGNTAVSERVNLSLHDLHQAAWAEQHIREMVIRGVVSGYTDGSFRPNQPISKIEALVMAVRVLGMEKEAQRLASQHDPQYYLFEGKGLDWAKGYLRVAYHQGLIQHYMQEHDWHEPADRAWMAQLMVRLLGKEQEALELPDYSLGFKDEREINPRSRAKYIAVAMNHGLLSGYPDRTFRPNQAMTRAELAALFTNYYDRYIEDYSIRKEEYATIEEVNLEQQELIIRTQDRHNPFKQYRIHRQAPVFFKDHDQLLRKSLSFLERNQLIAFIEHNNQVLYVEVLSEGYPGMDDYEYNYEYGKEYLVGFISSVASNGQSITLEDFQGNKNTFRVDAQLEILRQGTRLSVQDLRIGDLYTYQLRDNRLVQMEYQPGERSTFTGEVTAYIDYLSELHVHHKIEGSYDYERNMRQFYLPKGFKPVVNNRDYVRVYTYGNFVYDIELIRANYLEGYFRDYDEDKHQLTILDKYGKKQTFDLAPTREMLTRTNQDVRNQIYLRIHVPRGRNDDLGALHYNDYVMLTFDTYDQRNNRNKLEVISIQVQNQLQGTVESASYSTLVVRSESGQTIRYSFADDPKIRIVGIRGEAKRSDLRIHDKITYRVSQGEVTEVQVYERSEEEGTLLGLKGDQLTIVDRSGRRYTYTMKNSTVISWNDYRNLSRSELKTGQRVKLWFDGDVVTEVRIVDEGMVTGLLVDHSWNSVWLRGVDGVQSRYMLREDEKPRVSSLTNRQADIEDLVNRVVTLSFAEGRVVAIMEERQEDKEYLVIHIDPLNGSIRLQDEERNQYIYKLPEEIRYEDREYSPAKLSEQISFKQRVKVHIANQYVVAID